MRNDTIEVGHVEIGPPTVGQSSLFCRLPTELLHEIANHFSGRDHSALSRTCRQLYFTLQGRLFSRFSLNGNQCPLVYGLKHCNTAVVHRTLAYRQPPSLNVPVDAGITPMGLAAHSGHAAGVSLLVHWGANINAQGDDGLCPLTHATLGLEETFELELWDSVKATARYADTIVRLLDYGAHPNYDLAKERSYDSLWEAPQYPMTYFLDLLSTPWFTVFATSDYIRIITKLLKAGADADTISRDGTYPLHYLIKLYDAPLLPIIRVLLDHGAKPDLRDITGTTPLGWALSMARQAPGQKGQRNQEPVLDIIDMLLGYGADPNREGETGRTPLTMAVDNVKQVGWAGLAVVSKLLRYGAHPCRSRDTLSKNYNNDRGPTNSKSLLIQAMMSSIGSMGYEAAKADYNKLAELVDRQITVFTPQASINPGIIVTLRMAPSTGWANGVIPVLLKAGAATSKAELEVVQEKLLSIGGCLDGIHGVTYPSLAELFTST